MRKLLYIALAEYEDPADGVALKVRSQINGMKELGYDVACATYGKDGEYLFHDQQKSLLKKRGKLPRRVMLLSAVSRHLKKEKYDLCYIRFPYIDWHLKRIMKYLKESGTQIYIEVPTYPMEKVKLKKHGLATTMLYWGNKFFSHNLDKYVRKVLYVGGPADKIWNCESIRIANGCDVSKFPQKQMSVNKDEIVLIAVAGMFETHGYERLLKGLSQYCAGPTEKTIKLHMVGEGPQLNTYKKICADNHLDPYVSFHGTLAGEELDEIFNDSDIAIASLGMYKENYTLASTLKVKEYLSRGIPFVYACEEEGVDSSLPFVFKVENNDSILDMNEIIGFWDSLKAKDYRVQMREYAMEHYSWKTIFSEAGL